ncbi:MbcA/ParS/Xre antitoxin family protein [Sphingopyxis sp. 22461]
MEGKDERMETSSEAQSRVLSEAVAHVAALWNIGDDLLGEILGIAGNRAADLRNGTFRLARPEPAFRAGQYLVRLFQELAVLIGDDRSVMAWLQTENTDLGGRPLDLIRTERGLRELLTYLETRKASS